MLSLHNRVGLCKKRKRVGRGGDRGGTSGRGHKGQNARSGGRVGPAFEGGQMPLVRRLPKRGFNNKRFRVSYEIVSLSRLNGAFDEGAVVDRASLIAAGIIKKSSRKPVKILADGKLEKKLTLNVDAFSQTARATVEELGCQIGQELG
ncbi:50S ribosomal protein L15 [bacterium]|jgi:large subunit ribosomal protein L15|nr:50S ribosomal protein L15 [bacterium]MBT4577798.1 50S ribosomal protein L15 [bacterium]MBT5346097.1 50S ribosomal protein L15 [bacterium]MBT6131366.1 50S ribosomal protein L15 [bacterium]MBT6528633.1 50S ribosomal protein L15 [bacterium]